MAEAMNEVLISTDKSLLDIPFIHQFLSQSYWAKGRTMEETLTAIGHSLNFGVYESGRQIGYARVVTDYVQFAYLMDVFIDESRRGLGYAAQLVSFILDFEALQKVKVWRLATTDAHELYQKFGFTALSRPENMMERKR
ncbi:MAG: GNAT family N-acetyltransferase [Chitinophagaceae bacterium]|nr:GNAT family N-acetyltransferase [Chitinophagaceae bacterium]